ncbi:hypothetical protein LCY76_23350 [Fictibacillus sp. KIGAM418]|uniref:Uncharacterized protein n=1 Tax=Fictibacillus marinisediminis TaxID=2878389 RepID=A0A9X2BF98_9BACL|nr:hypothetical protein [Fictibacillus marinisediminis]MCK6259511.1 hypothetical protein [Fictibacillus marinisediminis]
MTEETIYRNAPKHKDNQTITVLGGSTENPIVGKIKKAKTVLDYKNKTEKKIHIIDGHPILNIVRKGKAGTLTFFDKGRYATNSDAFILFLKDNQEVLRDLNIMDNDDKVYYLKFLKLLLQPVFYSQASTSDNSTISITNLINLEIPKIKLNKEIKDIVDSINKIENYRMKISILREKIQQEYEKSIIPD